VTPNVLIVGGGISGLSAAYYLAQSGVPSTILEPRPRLGGVIQTERVEGCTIETGPDSFLSIKPAALELVRELGLADQVIGSNDHLRKTYIRKGGRLIPMPDGLMMMVPTKILPLLGTGLLTWRTKIRMGMELARFPQPEPGRDDQSVAEFIEEHYGAEAVDYLAEPLLSGIYGGNPGVLSVSAVLPRFVELAQRYGSLTRGVLAERAKAARARPAGPPLPLFRTLKGGLGQLVDAITASIAGKANVLRTRAETIERSGAGFRIRANGDWLEAGSLVVACEAHNGSKLLGAVDGRLAELLGAVPYSSSMTVALQSAAAALSSARGSRSASPMARWWRAASWAAWTTSGYWKNRTKRSSRLCLRSSAKSGASRPARVLPASHAGRARWRSTPWAIQNAWLRSKRARPRFRAYIWPATPTPASASPIAFGWGVGRRRRYCRRPVEGAGGGRTGPGVVTSSSR